MEDKISSVLMVSKQNHDHAVQTSVRINRWLADQGVTVHNIWSHQQAVDIVQAAQGVDLALVLGGDGVMLGVGRALAGKNIPLVGINFGRVGFLAEIPADDWLIYLQALLAGDFIRQEHLALNWRLSDGKTDLACGLSVNDVVLARAEVARAISLELEVDGHPLSRLRCDGVIISAPLGSTAYSASAGGPLTYPALQAQIVTPISPFAGAFPPLVLPHTAKIRLYCSTEGQDVRLTVDGQEFFNVEVGQYLEVRGEPGQVPLLVKDRDWYYKRLVERGFILLGPGSHSQT